MNPDEAVETAQSIIDSMLGYLGFVVRVEPDQEEQGPALQIFTNEAQILLGRNGDRLDDIQYLVNRLLFARNKEAPRVRVDIEYFRAMREDSLLETVREVADRVRQSGRPVRLNPLNSYYRRIVHDAFKEDPDIITTSPNDRSRMKRITVARRKG